MVHTSSRRSSATIGGVPELTIHLPIISADKSRRVRTHQSQITCHHRLDSTINVDKNNADELPEIREFTQLAAPCRSTRHWSHCWQAAVYTGFILRRRTSENGEANFLRLKISHNLSVLILPVSILEHLLLCQTILRWCVSLRLEVEDR